MRILCLADRLSLRGGADQHLLQVVAGMAARGAEVTVACAAHAPEVELPPGVTAARVRSLAPATASTARLGPLPRLLDGAQVVYVQNVMNPDVLRMATATGRAIVTVQDHRVFCPGPGKTMPSGQACERQMSDEVCAGCLPDRGYRRRLLDLTAARRDALHGARLVVLSRYMAGELERAGLPGAVVIPPWIEAGARQPDAGSGFVIGGRLVSHKGVLDGWRAWRLADTDQPLRVAGEGPLAAALTESERLGWLDAEALRRLLREARALLFPSAWQEPFGILAVEALAEGTPAVVADTGGTAEWSHAGCSRVPPGDVTALALAIRRLAADQEEAMRLGEEGQAMVRRRFAREPIANRLWSLYQEIADGERDDF